MPTRARPPPSSELDDHSGSWNLRGRFGQQSQIVVVMHGEIDMELGDVDASPCSGRRWSQKGGGPS
jgi:hypothetical protein